MKLPECKVPERAKWKQLRDKAGGKEGISKHSMGKSLDAFHTAVATNDIATVNKAIPVLEKVGKGYMDDATKKKLTELASLVSREILGNLKKFVTAIEELAKSENSKINEVAQKEEDEKKKKALVMEHRFNNLLTISEKSGAEMHKAISEVNSQFQEMVDKYGFGVPTEEKVVVIQSVKQLGGKVMGVLNATNTLDKELISLVSEHIRDHRDVIDKYNSRLGEAKGQVKKIKELCNTGKARIQEMAIYLKKTPV